MQRANLPENIDSELQGRARATQNVYTIGTARLAKKRPVGTSLFDSLGAVIQRFENCGFLRALRRPTFLRSTSLASRVTKPAARNAPRKLSS